MVNNTSELVFPTYMFKISLANNTVVNAAANAGFGGLNSPVFNLYAGDSDGKEVNTFVNDILVKLPYTGNETSVDKIKLITSANGSQWTSVDASNILAVKPQTDTEYGYLVFKTSHFSYHTITLANETNVSASDDASSSELDQHGH